ncbi:MAG TPA: pyridoxal-phosphate dependent enzyme [Sandaracinaceae bacterium LLY-WYZ-13_1]|nr:pyridoxal-phosphate dependent enzyme [Sandaracinaceae bacterium LLY-WYZ-13_1]
MRGAVDTILDAVGPTPIVKLQRVGAELEADLYVKCEYLQPSGSAKDRMATRLVDAAEASGALEPGGTIVEATTGNTGAALAMVAAVRGYKSLFVVSDKTSPEKVAALRAYGARVVVAPSAVEPDDPRSVTSVAARLAEETPQAFYARQFESDENPGAHADRTGAEIWEQTGGEVDAVVAPLGTGGTLVGIGRHLRGQPRDVALVGVDAVGSVYYDFVESGRVTQPFHYELEGVGADFFPKTAALDLLDDIVRVDDGDAFRTTRDLVRLEGLFVGGSSGAAVAGAIAWARRAGGARNVLVVLPDGAGSYLSKIFNDEWMREHGFLEAESGLGTVRELLTQKGGEGVITAKATDRVRDVVGRMKAHGISQLPVMGDDGLLGAVAEVDLLRYLVSGESSLEGPVEPLVESDYATVSPQTRIESLQALLNEAKMAIVLEDDRIAGVVTKIDLIDYLARRAS